MRRNLIIIYRKNFTSVDSYNDYIKKIIKQKEIEGYNEIATNEFEDRTEIIY